METTMDSETSCEFVKKSLLPYKDDLVQKIKEDLDAISYRHEFVEVPVYSSNSISNRQWGDRDSGGYASWGEGDEEVEVGKQNVHTSIPYRDIKKRIWAVDKINILRKYDGFKDLDELLMDCYKNHQDEDVVRRAGKHLGYFRLRVLFHLMFRNKLRKKWDE